MIAYVENSKEPTKKSKLKTKFRSFREKINYIMRSIFIHILRKCNQNYIIYISI